MDRPRHRDQIDALQREAELRLARGESAASVCKSLGISRSSYRRWQRKYGGRAADSAAAATSGSKGQIAGAQLGSSEENALAKQVKARSNGEVRKLSEGAKELLDSANDASSAARNAWLVFLGLLAYLLVTLGSVSHKALLLNSPVKLPIIDVDIPLFGFFQVAPLLLLLVYLALLIQHVMLAGKFRRFTEAIEPYEKKAGKEHPARQLVYPYVVAQILAGPKRNLVIRWLMRLMVFVTFAFLPIVSLLYFQVAFLPYHAVGITYWHRFLVFVGLAMLFVVLPIVHLRPRPRELKIGPEGEAWQKSPLGIVIGALVAMLVLGFSWVIATVPNEWLDQRMYRLTGLAYPSWGNTREILNPFVNIAYILQPTADSQQRLLRWLLSYRVLILPDMDLVADEDHQGNGVSEVLRERNLQFALLDRSDLHGVDLSWADLNHARLTKARLMEVRFENAKLQGADLSYAELEGAKLDDAKLQGADLSYAHLQGADLSWADLQGADLRWADLQGADLSHAHLQGANLSYAELEGADLSDADLRAADFWGAELWLSSLPRYGFSNQWPPPIRLPSWGSPLSPDEKKRLRARLETDITDGELLESVLAKLESILREDSSKWPDEIWLEAQRKEPRPREVVRFLAGMACGDPGGYIANSMSQRAVNYGEKRDTYLYGMRLAKALLEENCKGAKSWSNETLAKLEELGNVVQEC